MMKKQFNRMLQLANHTVNRSENSELLSEDLIQFENRIEPTRRATCITYKRLLSCLHGQQGSDFDKRLKKMPLMTLSQSMEDSSRELDNESAIRKMMELCCSVENTLAKVLIEHELQVEKEVLDPLYKLSEEELPNILKHKKQLAKLTLDWTAAKNRLSQATKSGNQGAAVPSTTTKLDLLKEDVEEIWRRVELCKDEYAADLYHFASKEEEYSNYFYSLMEAQADYHRKSLKALDAAMPTVRPSPSPSGGSSGKPAFGQPLEEHLKTCGREIALPIEACVMMLLEKGMKEEVSWFNGRDTTTASQQPLSEKDLPKKIERLREVCAKLPPESYNNLRYLIKFLAKLAEHQEVNKMSPSNIAIVLGPNLLWPRDERKVSLMDMASASSVQVVTVMEPIIQNAHSIFPEDLDFSVSGKFGPNFQSSTCASPKPENTSTEQAQISPAPVKDITTQREECVNEENPSIPPPVSTPSTSSNEPSIVEASPAVTGSSLTVTTISKSPSHSGKKAKKPALTRPNFPPPQQPKANLPWTSSPMCAPLTLPVDEKGGLTRRVSTDPAWGLSMNSPAGAALSAPADDKAITIRRATTGSARAPSMPPPPVPHIHQRASSMDSTYSKAVAQQGVPGGPVRELQRTTAEMTPPQPRCYQVEWNQLPQPLPRSRVYSVNPTMLSRVNSEVNGSSSGEKCGSQQQLPPATTEDMNEQC
ncbi:SH3 domain-binding protein 1-like [Rhincodon typus]|uniref:SH3 domain-binding protein 1-like n=1 Tax=Rhincodon typus TaxID=259920 RepID=UPI00202EF8DB|nr:SH3 domain-binding protein 1-like [Rhincodon typus]